MHSIAILKIAAKVRFLPTLYPHLLRIMKLNVVILLFSCLTVSANGLAQKVTIEGRYLSIEKVIHSIEKQTGYVFFYDYSMLDKAKPVSVHIQGASLDVALKECFKDQPFTYERIGKTIVVKLKGSLAPETKEKENLMLREASEQEGIEVKGIISDIEGNKPLYGAT